MKIRLMEIICLYQPPFLLFRFQKFEMTFPAFDNPILLHTRQFLGHIGAFKVKIVCQLLPVKRDIKFRGMFLQGYGIQIRKDTFTGTFWRSMKAATGKRKIFM